MKIKMKIDKLATADDIGSSTMVYKAGVEYDMSQIWQMKLATKFINNGKAESVGVKTAKKVITEMETKKKNIIKKIFSKKK